MKKFFKLSLLLIIIPLFFMLRPLVFIAGWEFEEYSAKQKEIQRFINEFERYRVFFEEINNIVLKYPDMKDCIIYFEIGYTDPLFDENDSIMISTLADMICNSYGYTRRNNYLFMIEYINGQIYYKFTECEYIFMYSEVKDPVPDGEHSRNKEFRRYRLDDDMYLFAAK
ncbi:MAG: hypothetical protein K6G68_11055 [Oscillospiraceae bacterium]|nr:hypothetical protein [Oscillospiraceae bacterium]